MMKDISLLERSMKRMRSTITEDLKLAMELFSVILRTGEEIVVITKTEIIVLNG